MNRPYYPALRKSIFGFFKHIKHTFGLIARKELIIFCLLFFPVVYLINSTIVHNQYGEFYLKIVDPEYFHLYNGVAMGQGSLSVQYIAHPATPLQIFIGMSARIIHFFQPNDYYVQDFVDNPEKYIHAANLFLNLVISLVIFIAGFLIHKYTSSTLIALVFQLLPFGNHFLLEISGRLIPETIMFIPIIFMVVLLFKYIYHKPGQINYKTELVLFGMVAGLGLACKLSFLPFLLIPFILLHISFKQKLSGFLYTILFFMLFAYPVVFNFNQFWDWISGIFTHSGMHGHGEKNVIDLASIPGNLTLLYMSDKLYFILGGVSLLVSIGYQFIAGNNTRIKRINRAIWAINATILVGVVLILKHFVAHYFMPFFLLKIVLIILMVLLFTELKTKVRFKYYLPILSIV